jgi:hypothetical protein
MTKDSEPNGSIHTRKENKTSEKLVVCVLTIMEDRTSKTTCCFSGPPTACQWGVSGSNCDEWKLTRLEQVLVWAMSSLQWSSALCAVWNSSKVTSAPAEEVLINIWVSHVHIVITWPLASLWFCRISSVDLLGNSVLCHYIYYIKLLAKVKAVDVVHCDTSFGS